MSRLGHWCSNEIYSSTIPRWRWRWLPTLCGRSVFRSQDQFTEILDHLESEVFVAKKNLTKALFLGDDPVPIEK
jgi:hypothetical protein